VVGAPLDFRNLRNRKARPLSDFRGVLLWDLAELGHRFTGQGLNFQPNFEFALVRPKLAHRRPGITIDHGRKIKAAKETESVLYAKKRRFRGSTAKRRFSKAFRKTGLANASAGEVAVVLNPDLATAEQVGYGRDGLGGVFGAGADGKNEIAQGKCARLEDLIGLFHRGCALFFSNSGASRPR
jgi:hypothetical protein